MVLKLKRHHRKGFSIFSIQNFMRLIFSAIAFSPSFSLNLKLDPTDKTLSWESNTLGARGFSYAVSGFRQVLKSDPREKLFFFSRVFGLWPKTYRPTADEAPRRTREKTSGTKGRESKATTVKPC